jgi:DNA-directed RNA polymerase III subunit RPC8
MDRVLLTILLKVIQKIGLCIGFYDLLESSDGLIGHGTGLVNVNGQLP